MGGAAVVGYYSGPKPDKYHPTNFPGSVVVPSAGGPPLRLMIWHPGNPGNVPARDGFVRRYFAPKQAPQAPILAKSASQAQILAKQISAAGPGLVGNSRCSPRGGEFSLGYRLQIPPGPPIIKQVGG